MFLKLVKVLLIVFILASCTSSKKITKSDTAALDNLKAHVEFLANDKLEGRRTGTTGERLAMDYISQQFAAIGLRAKGSDNFFQAFEVNDGKEADTSTSFIVNGNQLMRDKDFFVFPFSANQKIEALPSIAIQEVEMPWFFDLKVTLDENKKNPHFDMASYVYDNAKKAQAKGASAIILYNTSGMDDKLVFNPKDKLAVLPIPVVYVQKAVAQKYFSDASATLDIKLNVSLSEKKRTGHNVVGYIDNGAVNTVVLGAHYDHLGWGEDGNSRHTEHTAAIHNGADDNASGTAALIELGRKLKSSTAKTNNYLLIAFSGEELGLYGSKYFTEHPTIDLKTVNYMINMDMVGRLNDSTKVVTVGGYGTSPSWGTYYKSLQMQHVIRDKISFKFDSSGTGPSDHTSFYRKDIPVLFYFTGLHTDYHKPSDDADKINYAGQKEIIDHIFRLILSMNNEPKLAFTKTREAQTTTTARFSVSMGIMPDYTYAGTGVRADGVSEGKPAQKAGLMTGDVILKINEYNVSSMESYMQTLGKFKKGDKVKVKYKRGDKELETTVEF
jgi:aminopeptidase YwaD